MTRRGFVRASSAGLAVSVSTPILVACSGPREGAGEFDAEVADAYAGLALELIATTPGFSPPVASRVLGCMGVALYESVVPGMDGYRSLHAMLPGFPVTPLSPGSEYHWPTVANHALATILMRLFPSDAPNLGQVAALQESFDVGVDVPRAVRSRSVERGVTVAEMVSLWAMSDGGHQGYLHNFPANYVIPQGQGLWEPTPPGFQEIPLQPHWGANRPFVDAGCSVPPPPSYSVDTNSDFFGYAAEVHETGTSLTPAEQEVALFWADDPGTITPAGHSVSMLRQVLAAEKASLKIAAEAYLRVGCAIADSFIQCWDVKYTWNLVRPVTSIRANLDSEWSPLVSTPPFPEYSSGHSTQSGAWAEVMTSLFGDGYQFTDHTHDDMGLSPRTFSSFQDAAEEAAVSRLYGGIHYRFSNDNGLEAGRCVGRSAAKLSLRV
ncbi:MAG: vanadium-dependent haloperoxidase [Acidimicrobiia bacterium]